MVPICILIRMAFPLALGLIAAVSIVGCAVVLPPSGGPEDRTPPRVEECSMPPRSTNVGNRIRIKLTFSEYVDKTDVEQSILIAPQTPYAVDWSGRTLEIQLDSLYPATTHRLSISAGYRDLRGNRATEPFTIVFSTGTTLDSCRLLANITAAADRNLYALLIPVDSTIRMRYIVPVAADGNVAIEGLPCMMFTIAAFADANGNHTPDADEECGVAHAPVRSTPTLPTAVRLWLQQPRVTTPLEIVSARVVSNHRIRLRFSHPLERADVTQWKIVKQSPSHPIALRAAIGTGSSQLELITDEAFENGSTYVVYPLASIRDTLGGVLPDTTMLTLEGISTPDTTTLSIVALSPQRDTTRNESLQPQCWIRWSDAVSTTPRFELLDLSSSTSIPLTIRRLDDATISAQPLDSLYPARLYQWRVWLDSVRSWSGRTSTDTGVLQRTFITLDTRTGGRLRGNIEDSCCQCQRRILVVRSHHDDVLSTIAADSSGAFFIPYLPEGTYILDAFCDENGNGRFDAGCIEPLQRGERLARETRLVGIKARWESTGIILRLEQ